MPAWHAHAGSEVGPKPAVPPSMCSCAVKHRGEVRNSRRTLKFCEKYEGIPQDPIPTSGSVVLSSHLRRSRRFGGRLDCSNQLVAFCCVPLSSATATGGLHPQDYDPKARLRPRLPRSFDFLKIAFLACSRGRRSMSNSSRRVPRKSPSGHFVGSELEEPRSRLAGTRETR